MRIPSIGLDVDVTPVGVSADGQLSLPERPDRVGWYRYGPRPGSDQGSAVLAGHLDSRRYGIGPLAAVGRIDAGDVVLVTTGRKTLRFGVEEVLRVPKRTLDLDRLFTREGRPLLRIVTCGGAYDPDRGGYQDNVIVTARPR
nr:class F sortase [Microlunatus panaciterrae]